MLHRTPTGRRIYAVGGNPETARYSGIDGKKLRLTLFVVSGLVSAVAGIVFTARLSNARADNAVGFELDVITVALLGGINVFGGRGNSGGRVLGPGPRRRAAGTCSASAKSAGTRKESSSARCSSCPCSPAMSCRAWWRAAQWRKTVKAQQRDASAGKPSLTSNGRINMTKTTRTIMGATALACLLASYGGLCGR